MIITYKPDNFENIAAKLTDGPTVAVLPTDTVYGIVAVAANQPAVQRLYDLKSRVKKPGTLIAASIDQFVELGIPRRYLTAVERYWPGAVSVIVPAGPALHYLDQGAGTLAVRVPDQPEIAQLLRRTGPLMTSSANLPGEPESRTIAQAQAYFGDTIDLYIDGGERQGAPSTVLRVVDDAVEVLRQGAVYINEKGERA